MNELYTILAGALSIISPVVAVLIAVRNQKRQSIDEAVKRAEADARTAKDLEYIKDRLGSICGGNTTRDKDIQQLDKRITAVEESAKSAHKRLDELRAG